MPYNGWLDEAIGNLMNQTFQTTLSQIFYLFLSFHLKSQIKDLAVLNEDTIFPNNHVRQLLYTSVLGPVISSILVFAELIEPPALFPNILYLKYYSE
jgi:hypothetical protein